MNKSQPNLTFHIYSSSNLNLLPIFIISNQNMSTDEKLNNIDIRESCNNWEQMLFLQPDSI